MKADYEVVLKIWGFIQQHDEAFLKNIITMDETPLSLYDPDSKCNSMEQKFRGEKHF